MNQLGGVAEIDPDVANAAGGAPSSSKPGVLASPADTSKEPDASSVKPDASSVKPGPVMPANSDSKPAPSSSVPASSKPGDAKPAAAPAGTTQDLGLINSPTHRAARARLARRMAALTPGECPNMARLWEGTRKDLSSNKKCSIHSVQLLVGSMPKTNFEVISFIGRKSRSFCRSGWRTRRT